MQPPAPPAPPSYIPLADAAPKTYWSAADVFQGDCLLRGFVHRNYSLGMHAHSFLELNLVTAGTGRHHMLGSSFQIEKGHVFAIPPDVRHGYVSDGDLDVFHLLVHERFLQKRALELGVLPGYLMFFTVEPHFRPQEGFRHGLKLDPDAQRRVFPLLDLITAPDAPGRDVENEALALCLITRISLEYEQQHRSAALPERPRSIESVNAAIRHIGERYREKLSLADLAGAAHLQREYFCRVFRAATGMAPMEYLARKRIGEAQRLLANTTMDLSSVALAVGFFDASHFSRVFSEINGLPPGRFRKRQAAGTP